MSIHDFGLQDFKIKMDGKYFRDNLFAVAGDTARRFNVQLLNQRGLVQNTTGLSLRLFGKVAGKITYVDGTLTDATKGIYQFDLSNGMLLAPGKHEFQWQVFNGTDKLHSAVFSIVIGKNISEGGTEATNFYFNVRELDRLVKDVKERQDALIAGAVDTAFIEGNVQQRYANLEAEYAQQLTSVSTRLSETIPFYAKKFIGKLENGQPATVVFLGDSTTEQNVHTGGNPNHVGQLKTHLEAKYGSLVTVVNSGVSGDTVQKMWSRAYSGVVAHKPDLVIVCSGINDVGTSVTPDGFYKYYNSLLEEIFSSLGEDTGVILRTPNITKNITWNSTNLPQMVEKTRQISLKFNIGFADLFHFMLDSGYKDNNIASLFADDIHPNYEGQKLICDFLKPFFEYKKFVKLPTCKSRAYSADYSGMSYSSGWNMQTSSLFMLNKALSTSASGRTIEFEFEGDKVRLVYATGTDRGQFKVTINGDTANATTVDCYGSLNWRESVSFNLAYGKHKVLIETLSTKHASSTGNTVYVEGFVVEGEQIINKSAKSGSSASTVSKSNITVGTSANFTIPTGVETILPFASRLNYEGTDLTFASNKVSLVGEGILAFDLSLVGYFGVSKNITITIKVNDIAQRIHKYITPGVAGNFNINATGLLRLYNNDIVHVTITHDNGSDVTFYKNGYSPLLTLAKI